MDLSFILGPERGVHCGEEIFINYGPKGNEVRNMHEVLRLVLLGLNLVIVRHGFTREALFVHLQEMAIPTLYLLAIRRIEICPEASENFS